MIQRGAAIRGVLFDFDGTLTFPGAIDFAAVKLALGCPSHEPILEFIEAQPVSRRPGLFQELQNHELHAAAISKPNQGAEACLSALSRAGVPFGILTRNSRASVEKALLQFDRVAIGDFRAIITREISPPKPDPAGVLAGAGEMGILPEQVLVVGDFRFDIIAGYRAGARTLLLTNGAPSSLQQGDPSPDYICTHLLEVPPIIAFGRSG